jgi:outer membrane receptor protein involved in Fe transport
MSVSKWLGHKALSRVLLAGSAVVGLSAVSGFAYAQDAAAPDGAGVETIIVTGSKIARKDADSVGPLTTLTPMDIKNTGSYDIGDILQKLPDAGVSYNSSGTQGTAFGASSISLRYLADTDGDANRTLVLVDGHRWVDGVGPRGIRDFVDLDTIPVGMLGSIEVLQDGASAIYGADAIAGVVNIHTVQNFDGVSVNARVGTSSHGDGEEYQGFVNWGATLPHGSVFVSASYVDDQPVMAQDRSLTQVSLTEGLANLSTPTSSPRGLYVLPGFSTSAHPLTQNVGVVDATGIGSYHTAALPGDYYNTDAQGMYDVGPSKRYGLYGRITDDLTSNITFTVDALYNRRISNQLFSPTSLSIGGTGGTDKGFAIAANQAYNPFGVGFAANQAWNIQIFTNQVGDRNNVEDDTNYRFSAGLQGSLGVWGRDLAWSLFGSYSENDAKITEDGNIDLEHLQLGLESPAACAAVAGCVPINIFGQMTPTMARYITDTGHETDSTQLWDMTFDVTGNIWDLPAGPLGFAAGAEYRRLAGHDTPDAYINELSTGSGLLPLPASTPTTTGIARTPTSDGSYEVREAYVEFNLPILADLPLAKSLEADVAERFSDYSTVGSRFTNKVGLGYRPIDDFLLRATFSQAFRAPSLIELYTGQRQTNLAGSNTDPCNGGAAAHPGLPGCAGIPSTYNQNLYNSGTLPETISGNPNLKPETAQTFNYGVSWTPHWIDGMSLTSDWYQITLYNAISTPSAATALQLCATQGGSLCSVVQRDPNSGQVLDFLSAYENLNKIKTSGLDTTWRYNFDTDIGKWEAVLSTTYLDSFTTIAPNPAGGASIVTNAVGTSTAGTTPATARSTYPRWKAQSSLRWSEDALALIWRERFIGATLDGAAPALPVVPVKNDIVKDVYYTDLQVDYTLAEHNATFSFGIDNVFDQMPPASYANAPINYDMYTYDIMGRYFFVRISKNF